MCPETSTHTSSSTSLTIALVTFQRTDLLRRVLVSLSQASCASAKSLELRILVNGRDEKSVSFLANVEAILPDFMVTTTVLHSPVTPAQARNILCETVTSDWILFLDDDVVLHPTFLENFFHLHAEYPEVDVWGGPNLTPKHAGPVSALNGWLVGHPWIVGPVSRRYQCRGTRVRPGNQFNLMLCNLLIRSSVFQAHYFAENLKTAEENELLARLKSYGCEMKATGLLSVQHERRRDLRGLFRQIFCYGFGRGQVLAKGRFRAQWPFALFSVFQLFLWWSAFASPYLTLPLVGVWLGGVQIQHRLDFGYWDLRVFFLPPLLWALYGAGVFRGFLRGGNQLSAIAYSPMQKNSI